MRLRASGHAERSWRDHVVHGDRHRLEHARRPSRLGHLVHRGEQPCIGGDHHIVAAGIRRVGLGVPGATLASTGGTAPISWSVSKGSLPKGLSLNAGSGAIAGTPTATGSVTFTVAATDSSTPTTLVSKTTLTINIIAALTITTTSIVGGQMGVSYPGVTLASTGDSTGHVGDHFWFPTRRPQHHRR